MIKKRGIFFKLDQSKAKGTVCRNNDDYDYEMAKYLQTLAQVMMKKLCKALTEPH